MPSTLGPFRRTCEISLGLLRQNEDALMTVLETFLHDPTTDFIPRKVRTPIYRVIAWILIYVSSAAPMRVYQKRLLVFWKTYATSSGVFFLGNLSHSQWTVMWTSSLCRQQITEISPRCISDGARSFKPLQPQSYLPFTQTKHDIKEKERKA